MPKEKQHNGVQRLQIRNYKSIREADIRLERINLLVGRNGSGKSNVLDALHFISDCLRSSVDHSLEKRGGIRDVCRRTARSFELSIHQTASLNTTLEYGFKISTDPQNGFRIEEEIFNLRAGKTVAEFRTRRGKIEKTTFTTPPSVPRDRLYLSMMSGYDEIHPHFKVLESMGFYNLSAKAMGQWQPAAPGRTLKDDGSNIASVFSNLPAKTQNRINQYLSGIVPETTSVQAKAIAEGQTLQFTQANPASKPLKFYSHSMSDGTLRALGVLVAIFQDNPSENSTPLIGIEEPEIALHPSSGQLLLEAIQEASQTKQIILTTHSPDLLDGESLLSKHIKAVAMENGETRIAGLDSLGREALRENLMTAGELLRIDHLRPERENTGTSGPSVRHG